MHEDDSMANANAQSGDSLKIAPPTGDAHHPPLLSPETVRMLHARLDAIEAWQPMAKNCAYDVASLLTFTLPVIAQKVEYQLVRDKILARFDRKYRRFAASTDRIDQLARNVVAFLETDFDFGPQDPLTLAVTQELSQNFERAGMLHVLGARPQGCSYSLCKPEAAVLAAIPRPVAER
jgi:hypothetical protein